MGCRRIAYRLSEDYLCCHSNQCRPWVKYSVSLALSWWFSFHLDCFMMRKLVPVMERCRWRNLEEIHHTFPVYLNISRWTMWWIGIKSRLICECLLMIDKCLCKDRPQLAIDRRNASSEAKKHFRRGESAHWYGRQFHCSFPLRRAHWFDGEFHSSHRSNSSLCI